MFLRMLFITPYVALLWLCFLREFRTVGGKNYHITELPKDYHITDYTTPNDRYCFVGPYGWICDPSDVLQDVKYYTPPNYKGMYGWHPPAVECCTEECMDVYFKSRQHELHLGTYTKIIYPENEFYVNVYNGSDEWPGSRDLPWKTLQKAQSVIRAKRQQNTKNPDSMKLADAVQVWMKDFGEDQFSSRYNGFYYDE